jgi:ectoine hydroxylase-related dioxygenase (phytanoyl-CoA dioxygenase family)
LGGGCLSYLPGTHLGPLLPHEFHHRHLVADIEDDGDAVACPVVPGDATVHHCLTVHRADANAMVRPRRAFSVVCQVVHETGRNPEE